MVIYYCAATIQELFQHRSSKFCQWSVKTSSWLAAISNKSGKEKKGSLLSCSSQQSYLQYATQTPFKCHLSCHCRIQLHCSIVLKKNKEYTFALAECIVLLCFSLNVKL